MARIPTYQRKEVLTTEAPSIRRDVAEAGRVGGALERAGAQLSQQAIQAYGAFEQARRHQQTQEYELGAITGINDLVFEISKDHSNMGDFTNFDNGTSTLENTLLAPIQDQSLKDKMSIDFKLKVAKGKASLQKTFYNNMIDKGIADSFELMDYYQRGYGHTPSETFSKATDGLIDAGTRSGFWDTKYAHNLKVKAKKDMKERGIRSAISTDAEAARKRLLDGDYKLSASETANWVEVADKKIKGNQKTAQDELEKVWSTNLGNVLASLKTTSVQDLIQLVSSNEIDPKEGNRLIKWKTDEDRSSPWGQYEPNKEISQEIARDSVRPDIDLQKFLNRISMAVGKEQMTADDAAPFVVQIQALFETAKIGRAHV